MGMVNSGGVVILNCFRNHARLGWGGVECHKCCGRCVNSRSLGDVSLNLIFRSQTTMK